MENEVAKIEIVFSIWPVVWRWNAQSEAARAHSAEYHADGEYEYRDAEYECRLTPEYEYSSDFRPLSRAFLKPPALPVVTDYLVVR